MDHYKELTELEKALAWIICATEVKGTLKKVTKKQIKKEKRKKIDQLYSNPIIFKALCNGFDLLREAPRRNELNPLPAEENSFFDRLDGMDRDELHDLCINIRNEKINIQKSFTNFVATIAGKVIIDSNHKKHFDDYEFTALSPDSPAYDIITKALENTEVI